MRWLDSIIDSLDMNLGKLQEIMRDRDEGESGGHEAHEVQGQQIRTLQAGWGSLAPLRKMETLWRILSRG